jgi:hypothetical protein
MSINPFLHCRVFDPEDLEAMSAAFADLCNRLGLVEHADPITELVASRIIELASRGVHTRTALYLGVLQELKANPQMAPQVVSPRRHWEIRPPA